jgi:hypothetical protein
MNYLIVVKPPQAPEEPTPIYDKLVDEHYPCGELGHDGFWEDDLLGIWYCRDENIEIHLG